MTPARHIAPRRWAALVAVVVVLAGGAVLSRTPGTALPGAPPLGPTAMVSAADAESSAWYCTGQSTAAVTVDPGSIILTNTTRRAVSGTIDAVTDTGAREVSTVSVPAMGQIAVTVPPPSSGTWISYAVTLAGGGVAVTQAVHGSGGWSEAPCQSGTSATWFFPSGSTAASNALLVSLFNPSASPVVVDMSFATPGGVQHPINFQGLVLQPGQTDEQSVGAYVQNQSQVSTSITARTGRIVAGEVELFAGSASGIATVPGSPRVETEWTVPQALELQGGTSSIDVYNPGSVTEDVSIRARLGSGPLSPFQARVLPGTTWVLTTSTQSRIPAGDAYAAVVHASGGPGVVVGRTVAAPGSAQAPQAGMADAVDALSADVPSHEWVVPAPGLPASPIVAGALPAHLALTNTGGSSESYVVSVVTANGVRAIASGTLMPSKFVFLGDTILFGAGLRPLSIRADGPMAISEDVGPTGNIGVVTMPGIPLSTPISG